jgi:hypothetical protein
MKTILSLALVALTQVALADNAPVLQCSDHLGRLTYNYTQYDGGAFPGEPTFELSRQTWTFEGRVIAETIRTVADQKSTGLINVKWGKTVMIDDTHLGDLPDGHILYAEELTWDDGSRQPEQTHMLCRQVKINIAKP